MENSTYEELDYNELAPFLFYEGFRNKQGRVEHRYYSTKSRESYWNLPIILYSKISEDKLFYTFQSSSIASAKACNSQFIANVAYLRGSSIARLSISL